MDQIFKLIPSYSEFIDNCVNSNLNIVAEPTGSVATKANFSKVFTNLFPESGTPSLEMESFLEVFCSFKFKGKLLGAKNAVRGIYGHCGINVVEGSGSFAFLVYLVELYPKIRDGCKYENFHNVFAFMNDFKLKDTRVVIVGQDPTPESNKESTGHAYHGTPCPSTDSVLQCLYDELKLADILSNTSTLAFTKELLKEYKANGRLDGWIKQGVLLFNCFLTNKEVDKKNVKEPKWKKFTDFLIKELSSRCTNIVFLLTGADAWKKQEFISKGKGHAVFQVYHPHCGPELQTEVNKKWMNRLPYLNTNFYLFQKKLKMIDWTSVLSLDANKKDRVKELEKLFKIFCSLGSEIKVVENDGVRYVIKTSSTAVADEPDEAKTTIQSESFDEGLKFKTIQHELSLNQRLEQTRLEQERSERIRGRGGGRGTRPGGRRGVGQTGGNGTGRGVEPSTGRGGRRGTGRGGRQGRGRRRGAIV